MHFHVSSENAIVADNLRESAVFIASGAAAGAGISATIGGMGLAGSFGAVGIGMAPVTAAGAVLVLLLMARLKP